MKDATTAQKLVTVYAKDKVIHVHYKKVDIGFQAERLIKDLITKKLISEKWEMEFHNEAKDFMSVLVNKLLLKCPIHYTLVRNITCLDPREMVKGRHKCLPKLKRCLEILVECKRVGAENCDIILRQYGQFVDEILASSTAEFKNFVPRTGRVDTLLHDAMASKECYRSLWSIDRSLLLLSHGQSETTFVELLTHNVGKKYRIVAVSAVTAQQRQ